MKPDSTIHPLYSQQSAVINTKNIEFKVFQNIFFIIIIFKSDIVSSEINVSHFCDCADIICKIYVKEERTANLCKHDVKSKRTVFCCVKQVNLTICAEYI